MHALLRCMISLINDVHVDDRYRGTGSASGDGDPRPSDPLRSGTSTRTRLYFRIDRRYTVLLCPIRDARRTLLAGLSEYIASRPPRPFRFPPRASPRSPLSFVPKLSSHPRIGGSADSPH